MTHRQGAGSHRRAGEAQRGREGGEGDKGKAGRRQSNSITPLPPTPMVPHVPPTPRPYLLNTWPFVLGSSAGPAALRQNAEQAKGPAQAPGIPERLHLPSQQKSNLLTQAAEALRPSVQNASVQNRAQKLNGLQTHAPGQDLTPSWPKPRGCLMASPARSASTLERHALEEATCKFSTKWPSRHYK